VLRRRSVVLLVFAMAGLLTAPNALATTHISGATYATNTTWTTSGSPYVLDGNVTVSSGATLTIDPGVVVKLNGTLRGVTVNGTLSAAGTSTNHIVFTSLQDDTIGGDTGGDGPTAGAAGQWFSIAINAGSASSFSYVDVRYGGNGSTNWGYGEVSVSGSGTVFAASHSTFRYSGSSGVLVGSASSASLSASTLSNNGNGVSVNNGTVSVSSHSSVVNNSQYGFWFNLPTGYTVAASSVVDSDVTGNASNGVYIGANGDYPLSQMPWGTGNNIYGNASGGVQLTTSGYPGFSNAAVNWKGNYWGSDVYYWYNPAVCRGASPNTDGHLAYRSSSASPPDGPISSSVYLDPGFTTLCARDAIGVGANDFYPGLLDGSPVEPLYQTFGVNDSSIHARNASVTLADPVNSATGSFTHAETDLSLPGTGVGFSFERAYNSLDLTSGQLGQGWTDSYSTSLTVAANGDVTVRGEDGQQILYTHQSGGSFVGAPGALSTLAAVTGGYELTRPDQVTYSFTSGGRLTGIVDRNDKGLAISYDSNGRIATITDAAGRAVTFTHNTATGLLTQIAADDGRSVSYAYTSGRLTSVTDVRGHSWTFAYNNRGFLTSETDPLSHTIFQNTYGNDGRVTDQYDALNNHTTFSWNQTTQTLTATDPRSHTWQDVYSNNVLDKRIAPSGETTDFGHDSSLDATSVLAPDGTNTTSMSYDSRGNLLTATAPSSLGSATKTFTYNSRNDVTSVTDARGKVTSYGYDSAGNNTSITLDGDQIAASTYDSAGRLLTSTDGNGKTTTYTYDADGNVASVTDPLGHDTTYTYDDAGRVLTKVDPLGNVTGGTPANYTTSYTYNDAGQILTETDQLGHTTTHTYDNAGNQTSVTDANGNTTSYSYDNANHLTQVTAPDPDGTGPLAAPITKYTYDAAGNRASMIDPRGNCSGCTASSYTTTYTYDDNNRLASSTTPKGEKTTYGYDSNGNLAWTVDPRGNVSGATPADYKTTYTYDAAGRLLTTTDALNHVTTNHYDAVGNRNWVEDANSHQTDYTFDAAGRILTVTAPDGGVTTYTYDGNGNLETRTDDNSHTTSYAYNDASQLTTITQPDPDGAGSLTAPVTSYTYDANGNRHTKVDPNGNATTTSGDGTTTYSYDRANRLTGIDYSDATPDVTFAYDNVGNRTSMTDSAGTISSSYDNLNRLTGTTRSSDTFSYVYDPSGNITRRTYPDSTQIDYTYDEDNRLASVATGSTTTSYTYDPASHLTQTTLPSSNGYTETRSYDHAGRLTEVKNAAGSSVLSDFASTLDPVGNPTQITQTGAVSATETYTYDANDRLTGVCFQSGSCPNSSDPFIRWTYDKLGNRLTEARPSGTTNYTYNALDQMTAAGATSYGYDNNGNQTSSGSATLTYDLANRLKTYAAGSTTTTYSYDGDGNRVQASTGSLASQKTNYLSDTNYDLAQLALERDGSSALLRRYVYGSSRISMATGVGTYYFHYDGLGSVRNVTDSAGVTQWTDSYEPFGTLHTQTQDATTAPANVFKFAGEYADPTGLYHLRARQYQPAVATFTSSDPLSPAIGVTPSAYAYVSNRPLVLVDPSGMTYRPIKDGTAASWDASSTSDALEDSRFLMTVGLGKAADSNVPVPCLSPSPGVGGIGVRPRTCSVIRALHPAERESPPYCQVFPGPITISVWGNGSTRMYYRTEVDVRCDDQTYQIRLTLALGDRVQTNVFESNRAHAVIRKRFRDIEPVRAWARARATGPGGTASFEAVWGAFATESPVDPSKA